MHEQRANVFKVGSAEVQERPFLERSLHLVPAASDLVRDGAASACGIIIAEGPGRVGSVRAWLSELRTTAENFDLAFAILVSSPEERRVIGHLVGELGLHDRSSVWLAEDLGYAAQYLFNWNPGPPPGTPAISAGGFTVTAEMEALLKRSFGDCERVHLESLPGGKDSLTVFCVHAYLKRSLIGLPRPLPFFIKISEPPKIAAERFNYTWYADFYIPFNLKPNLVPGRCARIQGRSALVGNFVEGATPLREALRRGEAIGVIESLFKVSLKGFRSQPPEDSSIEPLADLIRRRSRVPNIQPAIVTRARELGLKTSPADIEAALCKAVDGVKRRFSPCHCDLHPGNVMVHGKDAILIDFSSVEHGPLSADPATLEVSLLFGADIGDNPAEFELWREFVDQINQTLPIGPLPPGATAHKCFSWLYDAAREIRDVLLSSDCKDEAAEVLAAYLLRFARLPHEQFADKALTALAESRQAYALVIAERIVGALTAKKSGKTA
jgi:hypothetical protein